MSQGHHKAVPIPCVDGCDRMTQKADGRCTECTKRLGSCRECGSKYETSVREGYCNPCWGPVFERRQTKLYYAGGISEYVE